MFCAVGEDGDELSAAGQMDTILGVRTLQQLLRAVRQCWASYFALPAVSYRHEHGQPLYEPRQPCGQPGRPQGLGMGVVIQQLVPAQAAGVYA